MAESVKSRIIARILALAEPLKTSGDLRKVERKRTVFLLESVKPALHVIVGDEVVLSEDDRGWEMSFPVSLKLIFADASDVHERGDVLVAALQTKMESDPQLNSLANVIKYEGETPFTEEQFKPDGGVMLTYVVEYRRVRGEPNTNY